MTIVYVMTSDGVDEFSAMTRISLASLRATNREFSAIIVCDLITEANLQRTADPLLDEADHVLGVPTPDGTAVYRNRYVKTQLRNLIDGPFLFIDSDTFIRGDLSPIFACRADIAATPNNSTDAFANQMWPDDWETVRTMLWEIPSPPYINGGVLFYNDTEGARLFANQWHENWHASFRLLGKYRDQPALNAALRQVELSFEVLPHRFNAQISQNPSVAKDAVIWHYFATAKNQPKTEMERMAGSLLMGSPLNVKRIEKLSSAKWPWKCKTPLDDYLITRMSRSGKIGYYETEWLNGYYLKACFGRVMFQIRSTWKRYVSRTGQPNPS